MEAEFAYYAKIYYLPKSINHGLTSENWMIYNSNEWTYYKEVMQGYSYAGVVMQGYRVMQG